MADLISRAYILAEYDRRHKGPPGGGRKIMEEALTIDAIPVEWLEEKRKYASEGDSLDVGIAEVLDMWQKEQEAHNNPTVK